MTRRESLRTTRRWVVKIGSALITADGKGLDRESLRHWVDQMADLIADGNEVVVVSSGAVAEGMKRMGWAERPTGSARFAGGRGDRPDGAGAGLGELLSSAVACIPRRCC